VANLSKKLRINFYQNRSSIVEVMIKKFWCVFYASQCTSFIVLLDARAFEMSGTFIDHLIANLLLLSMPVNFFLKIGLLYTRYKHVQHKGYSSYY